MNSSQRLWARKTETARPKARYGPFFIAFSSLAASPEYRERFLGVEPGLLAPKHARSFLGSLLRSVLRAARKALNSRSVVVGSYAMGSASLPVEASMLALRWTLSGMYFSRVRELLASPEEVISKRAVWARLEIGQVLELLQRPQPRVCELFWKVFGPRLRWSENTTCVFLGKNEGSPDWPR